METSTETFPAVTATQAPAASDAVEAAVAVSGLDVSRATTVGALTVESVDPPQSDAPRNPVPALRLPDKDDPAPQLGRMVAMCAWAAALVLLGMVIAVRTFLVIMLGPSPAWVVPTVMSIGIGGTVCAGVAFATVHHKWLPWQLLGMASLLLGVNLVLVITQL